MGIRRIAWRGRYSGWGDDQDDTDDGVDELDKEIRMSSRIRRGR